MKPKNICKQGTLPLLLVLVLLSQSGCFQANRDLTSLRNQVFEDIEFTYDTEAEFGIGSFWFAIANTILQRIDDPDVAEIQMLLKDVNGLQVGVYNLGNTDGYQQNFTRNMRGIVADLQVSGYEPIIRNYEANESVLIMIKEDEAIKEQINSVMILVLEPKEFVIVQLKGDVNAILETAIREQGIPELPVL